MAMFFRDFDLSRSGGFSSSRLPSRKNGKMGGEKKNLLGKTEAMAALSSLLYSGEQKKVHYAPGDF